MWTSNAQGVLESPRLKQFPWLWHGFGTRSSGQWPGEYTSLKQIHSDIVKVIDNEDERCSAQGDALVTSLPGVRVGVRTADCVPILLVDPMTRTIAAVHAGWRGTVNEIARQAVASMQRSAGVNPASMYAAIGPCIAGCCFEVGTEVASAFEPWFGDAAYMTHIDLVSVNVRQLEQSGVPTGQIDVARRCTVCEPEAFHSFRRDKEQSGRMVAAIEIVRGG